MKRRAAIAIAASALLLHPPIARGEESSLVTVVRPAHADGMVNEAMLRVVAELHAAGFEVRVIAAANSNDGRGQVESQDPEGVSAFATIAILETARGAVADVWVADHVTKKTLVRRVDVGDPTVANAASDLAVRSVELLRASLLEVSPEKKELPPDLARWLSQPGLVPTPPPVAPSTSPLEATPPPIKPIPPPPIHPAPPRETPERPPAPALPKKPPATRSIDEIAAEGSLGGLFTTGGFGAAFGPVLRLRVGVARRFALRASFAPSLNSTKLTASQGTVSLSEQTTCVDLVFTYDGPTIAPRFLLGGGFYHFNVNGQATPPYLSEQHEVFTAFVSSAVGAKLRLGKGFALVSEVSVLLSAPDVTVTIAGTQTGSIGPVAILSSLGLELDL